MARKRRRLRLGNEAATAKTAAMMVREYYDNADRLDENVTWWRGLSELFRVLLASQSAEREGELRDRVEKIEDALRAAGVLR